MRVLISFALAAAILSGAAARAGTLFDDLGGHDGVVRLTDAMLERAIADPRIKSGFEDVNLPRLKRLLVEHLCQITDGGCAYTGRDMRKAHAGLALRSSDFKALAEDLNDAMNSLGIPPDVQDRLNARLAPMQPDVVTR